jgi:hypothetical protein
MESKFMSRVLEGSTHDAVVNGAVVHDLVSKLVFVGSSSDLTLLTGEPVGTMAATYGFGSMWQLNAAGTWVEIGG